jgi:hypothetical protein
MLCIKKQLIINHLPIPLELADIIKEFCFQNIEKQAFMRRKQVFIIIRELQVQYLNDYYCLLKTIIYISHTTCFRLSKSKPELTSSTRHMCNICGDFEYPSIRSKDATCKKKQWAICQCRYSNGRHRYFHGTIDYISHAGYNFRQLTPPLQPYNILSRKSLMIYSDSDSDSD